MADAADAIFYHHWQILMQAQRHLGSSKTFTQNVLCIYKALEMLCLVSAWARMF